MILHRGSGRKEEEEFFGLWFLTRRYSGFWEYLIETFFEFEHRCCSERSLQRFCCNIHYLGNLSFILLAACWKELD